MLDFGDIAVEIKEVCET